MRSMDSATALLTYGVILLALLVALLGLVGRTRKFWLLAAVFLCAAWLMWMVHQTGRLVYGDTAAALMQGYIALLLRPRDPLQSRRSIMLAILFLVMALASELPAAWHGLGLGAAALGLGTALVPRAWIGRIGSRISQRVGARK